MPRNIAIAVSTLFLGSILAAVACAAPQPKPLPQIFAIDPPAARHEPVRKYDRIEIRGIRPVFEPPEAVERRILQRVDNRLARAFEFRQRRLDRVMIRKRCRQRDRAWEASRSSRR